MLLHHATRRLYYLNTTAAFVWCCLEEGLDPAAIAQAVAEQFGISLAVARRDVFASLTRWRSEGLTAIALPGVAENQTPDSDWHGASIAGAALQSPALASVIACSDDGVQRVFAEQREDPSPVLTSAPAAGTPDHEHLYCVGDGMLRIRYSSPQSEAIVHPVLMHLEATAALSERNDLVTLYISRDARGFSLFRDGLSVRGPMPGCELAPAVHREVLLAAYESTDCLAAVHAGAVRNEHGCLLLPGSPGSGKSTLTAALVAEGFTYLTDECALIRPDTHVVRPVPVSLGLKRGSWAMLSHSFPRIEAAPTFCQEDGTEVRYLVPPETRLPVDSGCPAAALVFPIYEPHVPTELTPISTANALYRLAAAGYAIPGPLETRVVEELIAWINPLDCYELRLTVLSEAVSKLKDLVARIGGPKRGV